MNTKNVSEVKMEKLETLLTINPKKSSEVTALIHSEEPAALIHSEEPAAPEKSTTTKVTKKCKGTVSVISNDPPWKMAMPDL